MKITIGQLRRVINEEIGRVMSEADDAGAIPPEEIQQMKDAIRPNLENYVKKFGELSMLARTILPELPKEEKDLLEAEYARMKQEVREAAKAVEWGNLPPLDKVELWSEVWGKKGTLTPGYQIWYSSEPHSAYSGAGLEQSDFYEADYQRHLAKAKADREAGLGRKKRR